MRNLCKDPEETSSQPTKKKAKKTISTLPDSRLQSSTEEIPKLPFSARFGLERLAESFQGELVV